MGKLRFGLFVTPFHAPTSQNPTLAYRHDVELIRLADHLGYDEAWIGEHHSCGVETIPDPMLVIAHVAPLTERIRLGTGVVSLPYHNPLWVADRILFLDHLTRGRVMLGIGPGSLPIDAAMIGLDIADSREALEGDLDVLMRLLDGESVSVETPRYRLVEAQTQLAPFSDPLFDIAVTAVASPSGPRLAGKHGVGMLSFGATEPGVFERLAGHWVVAQERAQEFGKTVTRDSWRMVGSMHLAETKEQAINDVRTGFDAWCDYRTAVVPTSANKVVGETFEERVEWLNSSGVGVIGTPDDAIEQITRLSSESGGFGCFLISANDWAPWDATCKSLELFARYVIPAVQGSTRRLEASEHRARASYAAMQQKHDAAVRAYSDKYGTKVPASTGAAG